MHRFDLTIVLFLAAYKYPFYAVQWHPERNAFEWVQKTGMAHSPSAVKASFYTASFFVNEGITCIVTASVF